MDISLQTANLAGIDSKQFSSAIQPLIQATLANFDDYGSVQSLSGPIARGDALIVENHLNYLRKKNPHFNNIYINLAKHALTLASQQGKLKDDQLSLIQELLN